MKKAIIFIVFIFSSVIITAQDSLRCEILLETSKGNITIELYNETPQHRDNFIKLVKEGYYNDILFHRVIENFMIQAGDSASKTAIPGQLLGDSPEPYSIPAEIKYPELFHVRGALAAAREGDNVNPNKVSSSRQFYIVYGKRYTDEQLDGVQKRISAMTNDKVVLTPEVREAYKQKGGTPHLDGQYTVFGQVTQGLDVVWKIQYQSTDKNNRPIDDIKIIKASILKDIDIKNK